MQAMNVNDVFLENDNCLTLAVTSGKGGVGKSNLVANLALQLGRRGKKVMVLDADMGMANMDVILGVRPRYTLYHVIEGRMHRSALGGRAYVQQELPTRTHEII